MSDWSTADKIAIFAAGAAIVAALTGFIQLWLMRSSAMRQLRAYVYLDNAYFEQDGLGWKITYRIKNFGQTPAYHVTLTEAAQVVDWNRGAPIVPVPSDLLNLGVMAPGGDFFENEAKLTGTATENDLTDETKAIYLVGRIEYRDVFKREDGQAFNIISEAT